ncbi:MAG: hypothetical protein HGB10_04010 [Coriobacteriia bacterium]|nr:hypothetical protein [Coriobacteriia bacterium]
MAGRTILQFSKDSVDTYKQLGESLGGLTNLEVFLIAMAWGFRNGIRAEKVVKSNTGPRLEYFKDSDMAIVAAVQLATTDDPDSLLDLDARYDMAEQFAEGGIRLLKSEMEKQGDFARMFSAEIKTVADEILIVPL